MAYENSLRHRALVTELPVPLSSCFLLQCNWFLGLPKKKVLSGSSLFTIQWSKPRRELFYPGMGYTSCEPLHLHPYWSVEGNFIPKTVIQYELPLPPISQFHLSILQTSLFTHLFSVIFWLLQNPTIYNISISRTKPISKFITQVQIKGICNNPINKHPPRSKYKKERKNTQSDKCK